MASDTSRSSAFLDYVGQPPFVCTIGTALARNGRLPVAELPEDPEGQLRVAGETVRGLIASGRGAAAAILYPREPETHHELSDMHRDVHATVFTAAMLEDIAAGRRGGRIKLPHAGTPYPSFMLPYLALRSRQSRKGPFAAYDASEILREMEVPVGTDAQASAPDIRNAVGALLGIDANLAPAVNFNVLQAIVMSPVYAGDSSERVDTVLAALGLRDAAHGRHAPVTAMVLNYAADVSAAQLTSAGQEIRARMQAAMVGRYKSMHVLAAAPDEEARFQALMEILRQRMRGGAGGKNA